MTATKIQTSSTPPAQSARTLVEYTPENTRLGASKRSEPRLLVRKKELVFNPMASKLLALEKGSSVVLAQDKKKPKDWYVLVKPGGFHLASTGNAGLCIVSLELATKIRLSLEKSEPDGEHKSLIIPFAKEGEIMEDGTACWALITLAAQ